MSNSKIRYKKYASAKLLTIAIDAAIAGVVSARSKLQVVLVAAENHYLQHGDYTLVNRVVCGVDDLKGFNAAPMIKHVEKYIGLTMTPIVIDEIAGKTEMPVGFNGHTDMHKASAEQKEVMLANAQAEMWWDTIPKTSAFKQVSFDKLLVNLIDGAEKKAKSAIKRAADDGVEASVYLDEEISGGTTAKVLTFLGLDKALAKAQELMAPAQ